jgi:Tfp pilus assembly protein PilO
MNKLSKEKRDKLLLIGMAAAITIGLWWTFVIGAQKDRLADYSTKIRSVRDKVDKAERLSRLEPVIEQNLQQARARLDLKQEMMAPVAGQRYWLLKLVDQFKKGYALDLLDISQPSEEELGLMPKFPYRAAIFGVKASAQYQEFGRFVADFENAYPFMEIRNIKLEPEGNKGGNGAVDNSGTPSAIPSSSHEPGTERLSIEFRIVTLIKTPTQ